MCSVTILYITSTVQTHYLPSQLYYSFHPKNQGHCLTWDFGQQYTCKVLLQVSGGGWEVSGGSSMLLTNSLICIH